MRTAALVLLALLVSAQGVFAGWGGPLDLPENENAADPMVLVVDGVYFLYATTTTVELECWTSADLDTWEYAGVVWEQKPEGAWNDGKVWAPEVHRDGDLFYLYYAANEKIGVAVADDPLGPFEDVFDHPFVGGGYGGVNGITIDAHVYRDFDGQRYFFYDGGYDLLPEIRVAKMIDMVTLEPWHYVIETPGILNWERFVTEGAWIVPYDGRYYLMYSGNGANQPNYSIGFATAPHPLGPYTEYGGNPIVTRDDEAGVFGPGHNSTVTAPDGQLKIVYHTKKFNDFSWDRQIRMNDLCFDADGVMYIGLEGCQPIGDDDDADEPPGSSGDDGESEETSDGEVDGGLCG